MQYRRQRGSDVWHWCTNCPGWPRSDYEQVEPPLGELPPDGELDEECESKERERNCVRALSLR